MKATIALVVIVTSSLLIYSQENNICANYWTYRTSTLIDGGKSVSSQIELVFLPPVIAFVTRTPWATEINLVTTAKFGKESCPGGKLPPILLGKLLPLLWPSVLFTTVPVVKVEPPPFSVTKFLADLSSTFPWLETPDLENLVISLSSEGSTYLNEKRIRFWINVKVSANGFAPVTIGDSEFKALELEHIIEIHPGTDYHIKSWWLYENLFAPIKAMGIIEPGVTTRINFEWELVNFHKLSETELVNKLKTALKEMERYMPSKASEVREDLMRFGIKL